VDDQLREARKEIDAVIEGLKSRATELSERAAVRLNAGGKVRAAGLSTGDLGAIKGDARDALDRIGGRVVGQAEAQTAAGAVTVPAEGVIEEGSRVTIGALGLEGIVMELHGKHAEVDVRGKRLRAALRDLRLISGEPAPPQVKVNLDLQPREGTLSELVLIGETVDKAIDRLDKFLDQSTVGDIAEIRIVHGHGKGQLRKAVAEFLKTHPLVERFELAPENQGGGGATIAYLKG
jgi:dsDNA-specific endonuclease/ATPase MutS2